MQALMRLLVIVSSVLLMTSCQNLHNYYSSWFAVKEQQAAVDNAKHPLQHNTEHLADFNSIEINGPYDVEVTFSDKQQIKITGHEEDMKHTQNYVKNSILHINVNPEEEIKYRMLVIIHARNLYRFKYKGNGNIKVAGISTPSLDVDIDTSGNTQLTGKRIALNNLYLAGTGPVTINGIKTNSLSIHAKGSNHVTLTGQAALRNLHFSGKTHLRMYWIDSPRLNIRGDDQGDVQIAGVVGLLDVKLHKKSHFDGRYLRTQKSYIKTYDYARADIQTSITQNTLARENSNIYYYKQTKSKNPHMVGFGSVLSMNGFH